MRTITNQGEAVIHVGRWMNREYMEVLFDLQPGQTRELPDGMGYFSDKQMVAEIDHDN